MKIIKLIFTMGILFDVLYTQAYTWEVANNTDKKIHVKINLACASKGPEADINSQQRQNLKAADVKLGINWAAGCCLSSVEVTPEGGSTQKYPSTKIWNDSISTEGKIYLAGLGIPSFGIIPATVAARTFCSDNILVIRSDKVLAKLKIVD
jgi:hypothetical protein